MNNRITCRFHCNTPTVQTNSANAEMLTFVSNLADGYLSGQRRSPGSILLVQLPHCFPLGMCFAATKFRLNRLRRWPSSSLNPLVGFQNSACILHAISLSAQPNTQSQLLIVDFQHVCPLHNSLGQLWTHGSFILRPSPYTARSGMNSVSLFCKFSTLTGGDCFFLSFSSTVGLRFLLTFAGACVLLRNQIVVGGPRRRDYSAPPAVFGLSHSLGDTGLGFEVYTHNLQGSSQSKQRAVEYSQFTGK